MFTDFREKKGQREKDRLVACSEDQTRNPGKRPDWEWNLQPFGLWYEAQPTEPPDQGCNVSL